MKPGHGKDHEQEGVSTARSPSDAPSHVTARTNDAPAQSGVSPSKSPGHASSSAPDISPSAPRKAGGTAMAQVSRFDSDAPEAAAAVAAMPRAESRIGQYEIIRELGRGGMGVVYLGRDDRLGRKVAVKLLQSGEPEFTRRFIIEARATARCGHENIVVIHEVGEHEGNPFMVLEYLEGQTLAALLKATPRLPPTRAAEIMASVVKALVCAHEQGIVHRDLKPDNIFLTSSGIVKVLDFGIAKVVQHEPRSVDARDRPIIDVAGPRTGLAGTMGFMSPEQWGVGGEIDHRTDIWSAGIILFEMLAGWHPLASLTPNPSVWVSRLDLPMQAFNEFAPDVPAELAVVVDRCLRKRKEERFPDAASLLRALEPFLPGRFSAQPLHLETGPYTGLRAFQEEDAARFFGRTSEIAAMITRIRDFPLVAAVGPSGVGKSSFIRAGVMPALKSSGENWEILVTRPGRHPLLALAAHLAPLVGTSTTLDDDLGAQREIAERLMREPGYLGSVLRARARRSGQKILLFVDQFEELYTLGAEADARRAFTASLSAAADDATSPLRVVASIRSDFLGRAAEDPVFMNELGKGLFFLGPPGPDGLRDALMQPAEMAGYRFEGLAMVHDMLQHLQAIPGALPLLQFTASQLWEMRDPARRLLTEQSYRSIGGITGALVTHADRVIGKLSPEGQALCRAVFLALVTAERTRAVRSLDELREIAGGNQELDRLLDHLVESRLLVVQTDGSASGGTVEIIHESLIQNWITLRRWLDESHEDTLFLEQLRNAARQWHTRRRDAGLLWGGDMATELERFWRRYRGELPETSRAFANAVFEQRASGERRQRWVAVGGTMLMAVLLAAAVIALVVIRGAQKSAEQNASMAQAAEAEAERRLREVEEKERARREAEQRKAAAEQEVKVAEAEVKVANTQVELTNEQLARSNVELTQALARAENLREQAQADEARAETSAAAARQAEDRARRAATELEQLLARERRRADRLSEQLGSPMVEKLQ